MATVEVKNLNKVLRQMKKLGVEARDLKDAFQRIGAKVTADATSGAPVRSGALSRSVRQSRRQNSVYIRAGGKRTYYAPFVHWGTKDIKRNRFMTRAAERNAGYALKQLEMEMQSLINQLGVGPRG